MTRAAFNDPILQPQSEGSKAEPWKDKCSSGCYRAKSGKKKCKCRCKGKFHGKAYAKNFEELKIDEITDQSDKE